MNTSSRFFDYSDPSSKQFFFELKSTWWSRFFEYHWCSQFIEPSDISLDAACGVPHPLKFYLVDKCKEVHACDVDREILSFDQTVDHIRKDLGEKNASLLSKELFEHIQMEYSDITKLPYENNMFDKVYCISVLEHLNDLNNKNKTYFKLSNSLNLSIGKKDMELALQEFKRVLKPGGRIILTFDYPRINIEYFLHLVKKIDLIFVGNLDIALPENAIKNDQGLRCFRALLTKHS